MSDATRELRPRDTNGRFTKMPPVEEPPLPPNPRRSRLRLYVTLSLSGLLIGAGVGVGQSISERVRQRYEERRRAGKHIRTYSDKVIAAFREITGHDPPELSREPDDAQQAESPFPVLHALEQESAGPPTSTGFFYGEIEPTKQSTP